MISHWTDLVCSGENITGGIFMYQYVKTYIENGAGYIILNDPKS